ncbi:MAG: hypothetical protein ACRDHK_14245, partial [Actinomycetota bacterium]
MPPKECPRGHHEGLPTLSWQDPAHRGEQHPVTPAERRPVNGPQGDLELMSEDQQFGLPFQVTA